ncbi:MAG: hypothetical protein ACKO21_01110 [Nodosilinea sp.]
MPASSASSFSGVYVTSQEKQIVAVAVASNSSGNVTLHHGSAVASWAASASAMARASEDGVATVVVVTEVERNGEE